MVHRSVLAAALFAAPVPAFAGTLVDALAACESFVATHAIPDTVDTEFTLLGDFDYATVDTELGPVLLTFALDHGLNRTTYCDLTGADPREPDGPIWVTYLQALPKIEAWLASRAAEGGGKIIPAFDDQRLFAACRDNGGYFISAQPTSFGDQANGLTPDALPLIVRINEWSGNAAKPCDF